MRAVVPYADPSPSLIRYRFERLWLKPSVRQLVRLWLPLGIAGLVIFAASNNDTIRDFVHVKSTQMYETLAARPELQVTQVAFPDVSDDLQQQILTVTGLNFPVSSLELDVVELKRAVETLDAVETAKVQVLGGGTLEILTVERDPVVVWRDGDVLRLVDYEGRRVADIARRSARGDLPLIVGLGAERVVDEAMSIVQVANPISGRVGTQTACIFHSTSAALAGAVTNVPQTATANAVDRPRAANLRNHLACITFPSKLVFFHKEPFARLKNLRAAPVPFLILETGKTLPRLHLPVNPHSLFPFHPRHRKSGLPPPCLPCH